MKLQNNAYHSPKCKPEISSTTCFVTVPIGTGYDENKTGRGGEKKAQKSTEVVYRIWRNKFQRIFHTASDIYELLPFSC